MSASEPIAPSARSGLPVAVIGAGPIGLAAAAYLVSRGETPVVLEQGSTVGASVRAWGHVRLFSPWKYLVAPVVRDMLADAGVSLPDGDGLPTGNDLVTQMVEPLARLPQIAPHVNLGHEVIAVTRQGMDKVKTVGRDTTPFELVVRTPEGTIARLLARAVIDASGTWRAPNPLGASGLLANGEVDAASRITYGIPDVLGRDRARFAGKRTLVVGSGHSAFNALLDLATMGAQGPAGNVHWAIRRPLVGSLFGGGADDALPERGALGTRLARAVKRGAVSLTTGFRATSVIVDGDGLVVEGDDGRRIGPVDEIIVATGFRPDVALTRELRVRVDPWLEAPEQLAPLIDPNVHSCGTVYPHGAAELAHPERDFYIVGMKSYGRAPTFLLLTGYEQVRSVVCALVGDEEGARNVELVLPETGVCQSDADGDGVACCGTSEAVTLGATNRALATVPSGGCC